LNKSNDNSVAPSAPSLIKGNKKAFGFQACFRIKKSDDFTAVFLENKRISDQAMILYGIKNNLAITRIGLAVGRRIGGAVLRNRYKRLLREAFRTVRGDMPVGLDLVVVPKKKFHATVPSYTKSLKSLSKQLSIKMQRSTNSKSSSVE